jgi:CRP-like cAMP-binding protein
VGRSTERNWPPATLLGRLALPARAAVLSTGTEIEPAPDRPLIRQGDQQVYAYLLIDGLVKVSARDENGKEALLGIRVAGDLVGEMAVLEDTTSAADVLPCGRVVARVMRPEQLLDLMTRHGDFALEVAKMISQRLRWANRRRLDFTAHGPRTRVARVLAEVAEAYGQSRDGIWDLGVPLTQAEIAQLCGTKLRTVEKELHALQAERVVRCQYRATEITDLHRLRRIALG